MKSLQIVAHTTGGEVRSAVESVTERDYDALTTELKSLFLGASLEFDTDDGWVVIPTSQIHFVEVKLF